MTPPADNTRLASSQRLRLVAAVALAMVIAVVLAVRVTAENPPARPADSRSPFAGSLMPPGVRAPAFSLPDQDGAILDSRQLRGHVTVVTFVYATCTESCGPQLQLVRVAMDKLGRDVPAVAISADPQTDTPKRARRFLLEQRMTGRMRFLLGSSQVLAPVYRGFFVQRQTDTTEHHARIVLLDRQGLQRVGYSAASATPDDIAHDIGVLERENR